MKNGSKLHSIVLSLVMIFSVFNIVPFSVSAAKSDIVALGATPDEAWSEIHIGDTKTVKIENSNDEVGFKYVAEKDMRIEFSTDYVSATTELSINGSSSSSWGENQFKRYVEAGATYYLTAKYRDETTGSFSVTLKELPVWEYESYGNNEASIVSYNGRETDIIIPTEIDGNTITSIDGDAFFQLGQVESVIIPDSVESIGYSAFYGCGLKGIQLPEKISYISEQTFAECHSLESVDLPSGLTTIGRLAFEKCYVLKGLSLPNGLVKIGEEAFISCRQLSDLVIPDTVEKIESRAFFNCRNLKEVSVGYNLLEIGDHALGFMYKDDDDLDGDFSTVKVDGFTIKGYTGSAAEEYAIENGFTFVSIGVAPPKPTISFTPKYPYEYVEKYNGYYETEDSDNFVYYAPYFNNGDKLSIHYSDERGTVDYYYDNSWVSFKDDKDNEIYPSDVKRSQGRGWTVGGNNTFTITHKNMSTEVPVKLVKPEDASIKFIPAKSYELIENREGYPYGDHFKYYEPSMVRGDKIIIDYGDDTVTYTYGSMSDGIGSYYVFCDENGQSIPYRTTSDQDNTPWTLGSDNYFILIAAGKTTIVPVTIIEYPVESIEFNLASPIVLYENQDGYYYGEDGTSLSTDENGYYYYDYSKEEPEKIYTEPAGFRYNQIPLYKDGNQLIIHNKDGSTKTLTQRFVYTEEDHGYFFVDENGNYDKNVRFDWDGTSFKPGSDNHISVKYLDTETTIPVTLVENNIESIEYQPIKPIVYDINDPKDVYTGAEYGAILSLYNPQKMHETGSVLTARFNDGTTKKYTFYSISNIRDGKYNPVMGGLFYAIDEEGSVIGYSSLMFDYDTTDWTPGNTHNLTVSYLGVSTQIPVKVTDSSTDKTVLGDVDGDGTVNINDATMIQKCVAELITLTPDRLKAADTNGDGVVNINDATQIQKYIAELIDHLG